MSGLEQTPVQLATSNVEQKETRDTAKKIEESNDMDLNLDKVDEDKLQKYMEMVDYIKENGGKYKEYREEFDDLVKNKIKPFEKQLQDLLDKGSINKVNKESKDLDSLSDQEIAKEAEERMKNQPEKVRKQQELIEKINNSGDGRAINKLNEIMTESMSDLQSFWEKISGENATNVYKNDWRPSVEAFDGKKKAA